MFHCSFVGGREAWLDLPFLTDKSKAQVSAHRAGPEKEGYLLAFLHGKIGLHTQFLPLFYPWWNILIPKLGRKKPFFSSSRVIGNITLVTEPFLV